MTDDRFVWGGEFGSVLLSSDSLKDRFDTHDQRIINEHYKDSLDYRWGIKAVWEENRLLGRAWEIIAKTGIRPLMMDLETWVAKHEDKEVA